MANKSTADYLPEIFQTPLNKKFLKATLDQVTQNPSTRITEGYIGEKSGAGTKTTDKYVTEPTQARENYQLESTVCFLEDQTTNVKDSLTYLGYLDAVALQNGTNLPFDAAYDDPNPYFNEQYYSWSPFVDLDKLVNYAQYYWLPSGPDTITITATDLINVSNDILGKLNYTTAATGVTPAELSFTNGLKIKFAGNVLPAVYKNKDYVVQGVGTGIVLVEYVDLEVPDIPDSAQVTIPYDYYPYSADPFSGSQGGNKEIDYITISQASRDLNPWTRQNRWVHIDVINLTARVLQTGVNLDDNYRGKRPIIEFLPNLKLFNFGTQALTQIGLIDFSVTDAFLQVAGQSTYSYDGISFFDTMTVIFPNDTNPEVSNKVYRVEIIRPDGENYSDAVINLVPTGQIVEQDNCVVCLYGVTEQGVSYRYYNNAWVMAQQKTHKNQAPLFDLFDTYGDSFSDPARYPSSTFLGNPLFTYTLGVGGVDSVLGFPISYQQIDNVGDIQFTFNLYTDSFTYSNGTTTVSVNCRTGFVREYTSRTAYTNEIGYDTLAFASVQPQQFTYYTNVDNATIELDVAVLPIANTIQNPVQISIDSAFLAPDEYSYTTNAQSKTTLITFNTTIPANTVIAINAISSDTSNLAWWATPVNLSTNPLNEDIKIISLNNIRSHYASACRNLSTFKGQIIGYNNSRDLGPLAPYATALIQHSAPVPMSALFLRNKDYNLFDSLDYSANEYEKFKEVMLTAVNEGDFTNDPPSLVLDKVINTLRLGKVSSNPFYWTDTIPSSLTAYTATTVTWFTGQTLRFDTLQTYDFESANYRAILVYINGQQAIRNIDYVVSPDSATFTVIRTLQNGDVIEYREYTTTYGTFVPSTPTKLGLYPRFLPELYLDRTYINPIYVIRGHDGSITPAFGDTVNLGNDQYRYVSDLRDQVLLEYETRIYNNLKVNQDIPLVTADFFPGAFRTTEYTQEQVQNIINYSFLQWVGKNKVDYTIQNYYSDEEFSWNYRRTGSKLATTDNIGNWRGLYEYYYDTSYPHIRPWEMLGFSEEPVWWQEEYGPAPYTAGNLKLWWDIRDGVIREPGAVRTDSRYSRPQILQVLPVDAEGELLSPFAAIVLSYDWALFQDSWNLGDVGPAEFAWQNSSTYPFALQKLFATLKPAKYFTFNVDRDLYRYDPALTQWVYKGRNRITTSEVEVYGNGLSKNSYINFIVDYNKAFGINATAAISTSLKNIDVRLAYRVAGYTDKRYLQLIVDKSTPLSKNRSLLVPDDSYSIQLYKNEIFQQVAYSAVSILLTDTGYQIYGNGSNKPYFTVSRPVETGRYQSVEISGNTYFLPLEFNGTTAFPYGYTFYSREEVINFICGYGHYLEQQGMVFDTQENNVLLNWPQMAQEFIYWAEQNWGAGGLYQLNPAAAIFQFEKPKSVVVSLTEARPEDILVDQNRYPLSPNDYNIDRIANKFQITALAEFNVGFINLKLTSYEHIIVLDNRTIFNDVIYEPLTGLRQNRILYKGIKSGDWNGTLDAPGFIINLDNVKEWSSMLKYNKGSIVKYKNLYYQANETIDANPVFVYGQWTTINYGRNLEGLLPNISTKAQQMTKFYDRYYRNLNGDADLLGYGITGFRLRDYMSSIDLDVVSQINVYNNFIRGKGTRNTLSAFNNAIVDNSNLQYTIYENWAIQRAVYGATGVTAYIDLTLDAPKLYSNPSTIELIYDNTIGQADETVTLSNVYDSSLPVTQPNVFPLLTTQIVDGLPSAGYVNADDVDFQLFDIELFDQVKVVTPSVTDDTTIWVAKVNAVDWDVFKCQQVPGGITTIVDNLSGQSLLSFNKKHNLRVGDRIIIREVSTEVDGPYQVVEVVSPTQVIVNLSLGVTSVTTLDVEAVALVLKSVRVAEVADIARIEFLSKLEPKNKVWVDNDGNDRWIVLERQQYYGSSVASSYPNNEETNLAVGSAIGVANGRAFTVYGAPGYTVNGLQTGIAYIDTGTITSLMPPAFFSNPYIGTINFGTGIAVGSTEYFAVSAPKQGTTSGQVANPNQGLAQIYKISDGTATAVQLILEQTVSGQYTGTFGQAMAFSEDASIFMASNGKDQVDVYRLVPYQQQSVSYTITDPFARTFSYNTVDVVYATQLLVTLNGIPSTLYNVNAANKTIVYYGTLAVNDVLVITRQTEYTFTLPANTLTYENIDQELLFADFIYNTQGLRQVIKNSGVLGIRYGSTMLRYGSDYDLVMNTDTGGVNIEFINEIYATQTFTAVVGDYYGILGSFVSADTTNTFGASVSVTSDGQYFAIGDPNHAKGNSTVIDGQTTIMSMSRQRYLIDQASDITQWEQGQEIFGDNQQIYVYLRINNILQSPQSPADKPLSRGTFEYDTVLGTITILPNILQIGDEITIDFFIQDISYKLQTLTNIDNNINGVLVPTSKTKFGTSVVLDGFGSKVIVGSPDNNISWPYSGSAAYFVSTPASYGYVTTSSITNTITGNLLINGYLVSFDGQSANTASKVANVINTSWPANVNVTATVAVGNSVQISIKNLSAVNTPDLLSITPSSPSSAASDAFGQLAIQVFSGVQTLVSSNPIDNAKFGIKLASDSSGEKLLVSSLNGTALLSTTFDQNTTTFDARTTDFDTGVYNSGSVEYFNLFKSSAASVANPNLYGDVGQFVDQYIKPQDRFGSGLSISFDGSTVAIGSPGNAGGHGRYVVYKNVINAFTLLRTQGQAVDPRQINEVLIYKKATKGVVGYLDFIDPLNGKLLGVAQQNIDYFNTVDPAQYNIGGVNNYGLIWQAEQVGRIWYNTSNSRFVDYHQQDIQYNAKVWAQLFPGSSVDIYQWIESDTPPTIYSGPGTVYSYNSYTVFTGIDATNKIVTKYYFWVKDLDTVYTNAGKTLSTNTIASYISNPLASGIAYAGFINPSAVALFNSNDLIVSDDYAISVNYDTQLQDDETYVEFDLIKQDSESNFLTDSLYQKMVDSFAGKNALGQLVPDPALKPGTRTGVAFRPRQTMFADRLAALKNYIIYVNSVILQEPINADVSIALYYFNLAEPAPTKNAVDSNGVKWWDIDLQTYQELVYQNINTVAIGTRYLINTDSNERGNWSIYEIQAGTGSSHQAVLIRTQAYNTDDYWYYTDWYAPGYSNLTQINTTYENLNLRPETALQGTIVKVTNASALGWSLYRYNNNAWDTIGIQNGTIQINASIYDYSLLPAGTPTPYTETRNIINGINLNIFTGSLLKYKNSSLIKVFQYITTEQINCNWLMKTSLIDVEHPVGQLLEYPTYKRDNQDFVADYIQEVKPYHAQIKDFNLIYATSIETYQGAITDFDLPATDIYNNGTYTSPILGFSYPEDQVDPNVNFSSYANGVAFAQSSTFNDETSANIAIWTGDIPTNPYYNWYLNYGIGISNVVILNPGSGYTETPTVEFTETYQALVAFKQPELKAVLNGNGEIASVEIINPGILYNNLTQNYANGQAFQYTPKITVSGGGGGTGAQLAPVFNVLVNRGVDINIKYDRVNHRQTFAEWIPNFVYEEGTLVRYNKLIWRRNSVNLETSTLNFNFSQWTQVPAGSDYLDGTDRTYGYYLGDPIYAMSGLVYPGVKLYRTFNGAYDTGPYSIDPYESDQNTLQVLLEGGTFPDGGTYPSGYAPSIDVVGGAFVDANVSYAPEELVPGHSFDTLDMTVMTDVGQDTSYLTNQDGTANGWSSQVNTVTYVNNQATNISYKGLLNYVHALVVNNIDTGNRLQQGVDYVINYATQNIVLTPVISNLSISAYSIGGGLQLFRTEYQYYGNANALYQISIPATSDPAAFTGNGEVATLANVVVLANGIQIPATFSSNTADPIFQSNVRFAVTNNTRIQLVAFGTAVNPFLPVGGNSFTFSLPQVSTVAYTTSNNNILLSNYYPYPGDTNQFAGIVEFNNKRVRQSATQTYLGNAGVLSFLVPYQSDVDLSNITNSNINVFVNGTNAFIRPNFITGLPEAVPYTYTTLYSNVTDTSTVTITNMPAITGNIKVTVSVTSGNVQATLSNTSNLNYYGIANGNLSVTSWHDSRQQQFDNLVYIGKNYDVIANGANSVTTAATWSANSNVLTLGFNTTGFWFGNTVYSTLSDTGNLANSTGNVLINGLPYEFTGFGSNLPYDLSNIIIIDSIDNDLGIIPISQGDTVYFNGLASNLRVQPRTVQQSVLDANGSVVFETIGPGQVRPVTTQVTLANVLPFRNYLGQQQWAVLLDGVVGNTGQKWQFRNSNLLSNTLVNTQSLNSLAVSNANVVVSVGTNGAIIYSSDLNTWSNSSIVTANAFNSVVYANGNYAAVGSNGMIYTTTNAATWTQAVNNSNVDLNFVTYVANVNVAFGNYYYSTYVAVGGNSVFTSATGASWTREVVIGANTLTGFAYANNSLQITYIAIGQQGQLFYKQNGSNTWTRQFTVAGNIDLNAVYGLNNDKFVAVGDQGLILTSVDGISWSQAAGPSGQSFIANGSRTFTTNRVYVTDGSNIAGQVTVTDNGRLLQNGIDYSVDSLSPLAITIGGRGLTPQQYANTIQPPRAGNSVSISARPDDLYAVTYAANRWIAGGANGVVMTSTDGGVWSQDLSFTRANITGLGYGQANYIAVGTAFTSTSSYQKANVPVTYSPLVMTSANLTDVSLTFAPNLANIHVNQLVSGAYIRKRSLIANVDPAARTIRITNPLGNYQTTAHNNIIININDVNINQTYYVGESAEQPQRLWVTLDGNRLTENVNYTVTNNTSIEIASTVSNSSVLQILTSSTNEVTNELNFKLFKDMQDQTGVYKVTPNNFTTLAGNLSTLGDVIHVADGTKIEAPVTGQFGFLLVGPEKIAYRYKGQIMSYFANGSPDFANATSNSNVVSGLVRGLAGTTWLGDYYDSSNSASMAWSNNQVYPMGNPITSIAHTVGQAVYNLNSNALIPSQYLDTYNIQTSRGISGNIATVSRTSNIATITINIPSVNSPVFTQTDLVSVYCNIPSFSANVVSPANISIYSGNVIDLTTVTFSYPCQGPNLAIQTAVGQAGKVNFVNSSLTVPLGLEALVAVGGTYLRNPVCQFSVTQDDVQESIEANTAAIPGGQALYANTIYVIENGTRLISSDSYTYTGNTTSPIVVTFSANTLQANANVIIVGESLYELTSTDTVSINLKSIPLNREFVVIGADLGLSWTSSNSTSPLQQQTTAAAQFFKDSV